MYCTRKYLHNPAQRSLSLLFLHTKKHSYNLSQSSMGQFLPLGVTMYILRIELILLASLTLRYDGEFRMQHDVDRLVSNE